MSVNIKYPSAAGIYKLTCLVNGKIYIGKSVNIGKRLNSHKNCDKRTKGKCYFQNAIEKYGWNSFTIEILEIVENFDKLKDNLPLLEREAYYIELFDSSNKDRGYNICKFSNDCTGIQGIPRSEETKEKIRQSHLGKAKSEDHREKCRVAALGMKHSEETKEKIRQGNLGKIISEEHKEKLRKISMGRTFSEETREKMRQAKLGKPRPKTKTVGEKLS